MTQTTAELFIQDEIYILELFLESSEYRPLGAIYHRGEETDRSVFLREFRRLTWFFAALSRLHNSTVLESDVSELCFSQLPVGKLAL